MIKKLIKKKEKFLFLGLAGSTMKCNTSGSKKGYTKVLWKRDISI